MALDYVLHLFYYKRFTRAIRAVSLSENAVPDVLLRKERFAQIIETPSLLELHGRIEFSDVENTREEWIAPRPRKRPMTTSGGPVSSGARILAALTRPRTSNSARREYFDAIEHYRYNDYAPWLKEAVGFDQFQNKAIARDRLRQPAPTSSNLPAGRFVTGVDLTPRASTLRAADFENLRGTGTVLDRRRREPQLPR